jgi:predicted glycoside hydrolase/deacetylase ChbG (UPF0249 family)
VNLTEGPPEADPRKVPRLLDGRGYFKRSFPEYYFALRYGRELRKEIEIEIRAQFEKAALCGLALNHVNGHQHVHMIPAIFEIVCRAMRDHGMKFIRVPLEPFFFSPCLADSRHMICNLNLLKLLLLRRLSQISLVSVRRYNLACVGCFVGVLYTGRMNLQVFKTAVNRLEHQSVDVAEVLFHPADIDHEKDIMARGTRVPHYYYREERRFEKENLLCLGMKEFLRSRGIEVVNHQAISGNVSRVGSGILVGRKSRKPNR